MATTRTGASLKDRVSSQIALTKEEVDKGVPGIELAIANMAPQFQLALPEGVDPAQITRDMIQYARKMPKLVLCEPNSVLGAFMTCAQLGLRPGVSALGQAYVLPFWNNKLENGRGGKGGYEAAFVIGYQGMIELANRSGKVEDISARAVHVNDEFDVEFGTQPRIHHKPPLDDERGELRGFYYVVHTTNGGTFMDYWSLKQMEKHRDQFALTKTKEGRIFGPWKDHFEAMALKTMIRSAFKTIPRSTELAVAAEADNTVRRDANPQLALEQLADVSEHAEDLASTPPADDGIPADFKHDTSPGAPSREEQWAVVMEERNHG